MLTCIAEPVELVSVTFFAAEATPTSCCGNTSESGLAVNFPGVAVAVLVDVAVAVEVGVDVAVAVGVAVAVAVAVALMVATAVGVAVGVAVSVAVGLGVGGNRNWAASISPF